MHHKMKAALVGGAALLATAAVLAGTLNQPEGPAAAETPRPAATVQTTLPGLVPASGEPELPGLQGAKPAMGRAVQVKGPFDDRFVLEQLAFAHAAASGSVRITSDVSDLLELEVLAGFYDKQGKLLGTGRYLHHAEEDGHSHSGPPSETEKFSIPVPANLRGKAVSAAVGVPVLVNE
ncbi:hypothetical protein ACFVTE_06795 [Arthrobacter sp. NPDC058097]|uniref:hypothetical protein n=1 Tax=Arthrobacter sp. NPDC058097 TaxID=3346340 RepID=UPI0036DA080A